jgi:hypothetical protein
MTPARSSRSADTVVEAARETGRVESFELVFLRDAQQLLQGAVIPPAENLSPKLLADLESHAAAVAQVLRSIETAQIAVGKALAEADDSGDVLGFAAAVEDARLNQPRLAQNFVKLQSDAIQLADRKVEELQPVSEKLVAKADKIVDEVRDQLTKIGCGLEAQPAYENNADAAEAAFSYLARNVNTRSRAALAAAADSREEIHAAARQRANARQGLEQAKTYLRKLAVRMVQA